MQMDENIESYSNLIENLAEYGKADLKGPIRAPKLYSAP